MSANQTIFDYQDLDRVWFERNRNRNYRIRPLCADERFAPPWMDEPQAPPGFFFDVLIKQIKPGIRLRIPVIHSDRVDNKLAHDDSYLDWLFYELRPDLKERNL